jgi:general secretion pathway protein F
VSPKPERAGGSKIPAAELAIGLRVLADLLDSGLSASRALAALHQVVTGRFQAILPEIQESVRQGRSLGSALASPSAEIPAIVVGVIHAGENGGGLAPSVRRAADIMEEAAALRAAILGALAYPTLLFVSGAASVAVLVLVVLPRFATILGDMGQSLPRMTMWVLSGAALAKSAFIPSLVLCVLMLVAWNAWTSTDGGRRTWHEFLLAVPLLGQTRFAAATGRGCGALSALLENGLPLATALPLAGRATGDAALLARYADARQLLARGVSLGKAFDETAAVSDVAIRLTRAGEESGRLPAMLEHAARLERERATRLTKRAVQVLEPLLIVIFGAVIAVVAGALLQAVYSVRPGS